MHHAVDRISDFIAADVVDGVFRPPDAMADQEVVKVDVDIGKRPDEFAIVEAVARGAVRQGDGPVGKVLYRRSGESMMPDAKSAEDLKKELEAKGFKITQPTPEAIAAMRERVAPVVDEYSEKIGTDLVEQARAAMAAVAK